MNFNLELLKAVHTRLISLSAYLQQEPCKFDFANASSLKRTCIRDNVKDVSLQIQTWNQFVLLKKNRHGVQLPTVDHAGRHGSPFTFNV